MPKRGAPEPSPGGKADATAAAAAAAVSLKSRSGRVVKPKVGRSAAGHGWCELNAIKRSNVGAPAVTEQTQTGCCLGCNALLKLDGGPAASAASPALLELSTPGARMAWGHQRETTAHDRRALLLLSLAPSDAL